MSADVTPRSPRLLIYNPQLWERNALLSAQSARNNVLEALRDALRRCMRDEVVQHQLISGASGSGKTMLSCCLEHVINDDEELKLRCIAIRLPYQQLNVGELSDLYMNAVKALAKRLVAKPAQALIGAQLKLALERLPEFEGSRAELLWQALDDAAAALGKRLVLLVDDFDRVLTRLAPKRRQQLSKHLLTSGAPLMVATATVPTANVVHSFGRGCGFSQHDLRALTAQQARMLLSSLADRQLADGVRRLVQQQPDRVDALTALAGRQPRSITLLFESLTSSSEATSHFQLEGYLDRLTPQYQALIDALPTQAQLVFDALARKLSPARAAELGEALRLETNAVSSQLHRLVKSALVQKVPYDPPRRAGFQLAERTMNLWYLMRAGGQCRQKLAAVVAYRRLEPQARLSLAEISPNAKAAALSSGLPLSLPSGSQLGLPQSFHASFGTRASATGVTSIRASEPLRLSEGEYTQLQQRAEKLSPRWPEIQNWVSGLGAACAECFPELRFSAMVQLLAAGTHHGKAEVLVELLSSEQSSGAPLLLRDRWQPLLLPLQAVVLGHRLPLRRLAPELRAIAECVLQVIHSGQPLPEEPGHKTQQ